ncbi:MAG: orotidine-5'-phosphate decarboxylase [Leptospirales bacterium]|nr:orotidine-5'-phosphate decarboxylase [Leptospirales bacterium]
MARRSNKRTILCVGLDPDPSLLPSAYQGSTGILSFLDLIVRATADQACAYKPNVAFFEAMGEPGWGIFASLISTIRKVAPEALIVADAKRGDLGNTAKFYAQTFFDRYDCDGLTVNPYMGIESLQPYDTYPDRGVFALCLTSNPGAAEFQLRGTPPLYEAVAAAVEARHRLTGNYWMVAGATREAESFSRIKSLAPNVPLLIPGIGAQGGELGTVLRTCGKDVLINSSRGIMYAYKESGKDIAESAHNAAGKLNGEIQDLVGF